MGEVDINIFEEGNHQQILRKMGDHLNEIDKKQGVMFCLWALMQKAFPLLVISIHGMVDITLCKNVWENLGTIYTWSKEGDLYKYEIRTEKGHCYEKADPYGFQHEVRPAKSSVISKIDSFQWNDQSWISKREKENPLEQPISVYEMHLGSWMHASTDDPFINSNGEPRAPVPAADMKPGSRLLTYKELANKVIPYVKERLHSYRAYANFRAPF